MTAAATATPTTETAKPKPTVVKNPETLFVLDTTAQPDSTDSQGKTLPGARHHQMPVDGILKTFIFEHGKPLEMPRAIALKFLKHDGWKLTDKDGNLKTFRRPPKQPHELQAGEQLVVANDETVARYDELSTNALQHRVLEMVGGEKFAGSSPNRDAMIDFIVAAKVAAAKLNTSKKPDVGRDEFVPDADLDEVA